VQDDLSFTQKLWRGKEFVNAYGNKKKPRIDKANAPFNAKPSAGPVARLDSPKAFQQAARMGGDNPGKHPHENPDFATLHQGYAG
jgi:hypothetical protein